MKTNHRYLNFPCVFAARGWQRRALFVVILHQKEEFTETDREAFSARKKCLLYPQAKPTKSQNRFRSAHVDPPLSFTFVHSSKDGGRRKREGDECVCHPGPSGSHITPGDQTCVLRLDWVIEHDRGLPQFNYCH